MRKTLLTLLSTCATMMAQAQAIPQTALASMNQTMQRYYAGCQLLLNGIAQQSESILDEAFRLLDENERNKDRIKLQNLEVEYSVSSDTMAVGTHVYFNGDYAKYCLKQAETPFVAKTSLMRGDNDSDCFVHQDALRGNGKVTYTVVMGGYCQLLVIAEKNAKLKVTVEEQEATQTHQATIYENGSVAFVEWTQGDNSQETNIKVENLSGKDISFILATN